MARTAVGLLALLTLLSPLAPLGPAIAGTATAAAGPSVDATVDGGPLGGERVVVTADPAVSVEAGADRPIRTVAVRVDGTVVRSFSPNRTEVERTVPLDLDRGPHRVEVVAEAGDRASLVGTVVKDTGAPRVAYTAPFASSPAAGPPEATRVDSPSIRLAGDLVDESRVTRVTITHTYTYTHAGERRRHRRSYTVQDPGAALSQRLFLGLGTNRLRVRVKDAAGHARTREFDVVLRDRDPPTVRFERVERVGNGSRVRVVGVVTDDVKVDSVTVTRGYGNSERFLVKPTTHEPDPDRRSVRFETTVPVDRRTGRVRVVARDLEGTRASRQLPDEYGRPAVPEVRITDATVDGGTVGVRGTVEGGEIARVVVETRTGDGERLGLATVHDGTARVRVDVDRRLGAAPEGPTVVRLRAVDATGTERVATHTVGATETATATATDRPRTVEAATAAAPTPDARADGVLPAGVTDRPALAAGVAAATLSTLAAALVVLVR